MNIYICSTKTPPIRSIVGDALDGFKPSIRMLAVRKGLFTGHWPASDLIVILEILLSFAATSEHHRKVAFRCHRAYVYPLIVNLQYS